MGFHEVIDGNHRLAKLKAENKINLAEIYMIDSTILSKKGYLDSFEDHDLFEEFIRNNGVKINSNEIEIEA